MWVRLSVLGGSIIHRGWQNGRHDHHPRPTIFCSLLSFASIFPLPSLFSLVSSSPKDSGTCFHLPSSIFPLPSLFSLLSSSPKDSGSCFHLPSSLFHLSSVFSLLPQRIQALASIIHLPSSLSLLSSSPKGPCSCFHLPSSLFHLSSVFSPLLPFTSISPLPSSIFTRPSGVKHG